MNLRRRLLAAIVLSHLSLANGQNGPSFATPNILPAVFLVGADLAVADLNGDGVPDLIQANPGLAFGPNFVTYRAKLLEDDGTELANAGGAPPVGPISASVAVRVATGDFDGDGLPDLVSLTYGLGINTVRNQGMSQQVPGFGANVLVDDLNAYFGYAWPVVLRVPVFEVQDFDGDGHLDLLLAPTLVDYWAQHITSPGLFLYFGRGDGTFEPVVRAPLPSTPLDADWVDWDGDGIRETLVLLGQQVPNALQCIPDVTRFRFGGRSISQLGAPQTIPAPLLATSLVHVARGSAMGGRHAYFVGGHSSPVGWLLQPELWAIDVDPQGRVGVATAIALPPALAAVPQSDLQSLQVADFDGDGSDDLVALHVCGLSAPASLVFVMGPLDSFGTIAGMHVLGLDPAFANAENAAASSAPGLAPVWAPNLSTPDCIAIADLNQDQLPDLLVGGLMLRGANSVQMATATLQNLAQPPGAAWRGSATRVGPARPTPAGLRARCGTRGGLPVIGNQGFGLTLSNAPRDAFVAAVAGLAHGPFAWQGLPLAFVPDHYGSPTWLHAAVEGGSRAAHDLPIPNQPTMIGMRAYFQWLILDANSAEPFPIYCSDTLEVFVGQPM